MPNHPPPVDPDDQPVFEALLAAGVEPGLAYTALQSIRYMAAANLIARFESKLDAQKVLLESKLDAQATQLKMLMWMIGAAVAILGILVRIWG